jgi:hypothetical protein
MTSESRKLQRERKKKAEKELKKKLGLFNKIPDHCLNCEASFDKKNREQVMSWSVVVRKQEGIVRLYCPVCWEAAKQLVKEVKDGSTDTENNV